MYFSDCQNVELAGLNILVPFLNKFSTVPPQSITDEHQQKTIGDLMCHFKNLGETSVEVKIESRFTGNLFIETWSNREWGTPGWLHTCQADLLVYYFLDEDRLVTCGMSALRHWCIGKADPHIDQYPVKQVKQNQRNDTVGTIVPICDLRDAKLDHWYECRPKQVLSQGDTNEPD